MEFNIARGQAYVKFSLIFCPEKDINMEMTSIGHAMLLRKGKALRNVRRSHYVLVGMGNDRVAFGRLSDLYNPNARAEILQRSNLKTYKISDVIPGMTEYSSEDESGDPMLVIESDIAKELRAKKELKENIPEINIFGLEGKDAATAKGIRYFASIVRLIELTDHSIFDKEADYRTFEAISRGIIPISTRAGSFESAYLPLQHHPKTNITKPWELLHAVLSQRQDSFGILSFFHLKKPKKSDD